MVARTRYCIHPADAVDKIPAVGGTKKVNMRKLREQAPTHVVLNVDENTREMADGLAEFVPNVVVTHPVRPEDNLALYRLMGGIFGKEEAAAQLCDTFSEELGKLREAADHWRELNVLYLIWKDPWMTVSHDTYVAETLRLARMVNSVHDSDVRYPEVEMTDELLDRTDLVLLSSEPYTFGQEHVDLFLNEYGRPDLSASLIDGEMTSWYGSRAIRGLRYLREFAGAYHARTARD